MQRSLSEPRRTTVDVVEQPYEAPAPFAPPSLRSAPLNELAVYGRSTYPHPPMVPCPRRLGAGQWQPGAGWQPVAAAPVRPRAAARSPCSPRCRSRCWPSSRAGHRPRRARAALAEPAPVGRLLRPPLHAERGPLRSIFGSNGAFGNIPTADLTKARIGIYGRGAQSAPSALFIGFTATDSPNIGQQLHAEAATEVTSDVLASAGAGRRRGGRGTAGRFAAVRQGPRRRTVRLRGRLGRHRHPRPGAVVRSSFGPSTDETGAVARAFRTQAEH